MPDLNPPVDRDSEFYEIWQRRLGRIRLDAEPVETQLARYRRVTWGITGVATGFATMFLALFWAFGRPDIGLILILVFPAPVAGLAWFEDAKLRRVARAYQQAVQVQVQGRPTSDDAH